MLPDGTLSQICPAKLVTAESLELLRWHQLFKQGHLPAAGGMLHQTAYFWGAMQAVENVIAEASDGQ